MKKDQKVRYINMIVKGVAILTTLKDESQSEEMTSRTQKLLDDLNEMLVVLILTEDHPYPFIMALENVESTINEIEKYTQMN